MFNYLVATCCLIFCVYGTTTNTSARLFYYGGPILWGETPVYLIYYGEDWSRQAEKRRLLDYFVDNLNQTEWFDYVRQYVDYDGRRPTSVRLGKSIVLPNYAYGQRLLRSDAVRLLHDLFEAQTIPFQPQAIYHLIGDKNTQLCLNSQQCSGTHFCGVHLFGAAPAPYESSTRMLYNFAFDPSKTASIVRGCSWEGTFGSGFMPNPMGVDSMASTVAHELVEAITDPFATSYFTTTQPFKECQDLCGWTEKPFHGIGRLFLFHTNTAGKQRSVVVFNKMVGGQPYFIQGIYHLSQQRCVYNAQRNPAKQWFAAWNETGATIATWENAMDSSMRTEAPTGWLALPGKHPDYTDANYSEDGLLPVDIGLMNGSSVITLAPAFIALISVGCVFMIAVGAMLFRQLSNRKSRLTAVKPATTESV